MGRRKANQDYNVDSITQRTGIEAVRQNPSLFIGNTENPTKLLEEILDNALDEVQAGFCNKIIVTADTKKNEYSISDNGRGFPFDQTLPLEEDRPIFACVNLHSSGKFNKGSDASPYKIASGLHGVGLTAVFALSKSMVIEIYKNKLHATYNLIENNITRSQEKFTDTIPFSTKISFIPSNVFFEDLKVDMKLIEERLEVANVNYPELNITVIIDGKSKSLSCNEDTIIKHYLTETKDVNWLEFEEEKEDEYFKIKLGWDNELPITQKIFTSVNLSRVHDGVHINKATGIIKNIFQTYAKKNKFEFQPEDSLNWLRLYINLKIVKTSFEAQVKVKLERNSDISIMDKLEDKIKNYFSKNEDQLLELLERFQHYRKNILSKNALKGTSSKKRASTNFTKLKDCSEPGGELIIGEGESAVSGLVQVRNIKKHAILPLRGVIVNSLTKKDLLNNTEVKDIIQAVGCNISDFKLEDLRYDKIILAADADPAGHFITTLLIVLFAHLYPDIIKNKKLYVCETPLFGHGKNENFEPLWDQKSLDDARNKNIKIRRIKGLGEFNPIELKKFTLDPIKRKLILVEWSEEHKEKLFNLMTNSEDKRDLALGTWKLKN